MPLYTAIARTVVSKYDFNTFIETKLHNTHALACNRRLDGNGVDGIVVVAVEFD